MIRKYICIIIFFTTAACILFADILSETEQAAVQNIMEFRKNLALCSNPKEALERIETFKVSFYSDENKQLSEQARLICENFFVMERYNYLYEADIRHPELKNLITTQNKRNEEWFSNHTDEKTSSYLYCTAGDVISCCMQFMSVPKAMKQGLIIKKYYDSALEQDPDIVYCMMSMAQWYFHAPAIGGGSKKKAMEYFKKAAASAKTPAEIYYAKILLSQAVFDIGNTEECSALLSDADAVIPGGRYVAHLRNINSAGFSLFSYMLDREKIDEKLQKKDRIPSEIL